MSENRTTVASRAAASCGRAAGALLCVLALAIAVTGCGPTSRQRQAMLMATEGKQAAAAKTGSASTTAAATSTTDSTASSLGAPGSPPPTRGGIPGTVSSSAGAQPPASATPLIDEASYRVAPGDLLDIRFPFHPEENLRAPVRADGRLNLPLSGDIEAAGLSISELQTAILEKVSERMRGPQVNVVVAELAEHKVFVTGQVARPGYVPFRPGLTSMQAIVERGGFLDDAKMDEIVHLHRRGGAMVSRKIDLEAAFEGQTTDQNTLAPNDIVIVPRTFIGDADVFVDQWIRGLLPTIPRPGIDLPLLFF